MMFLMSKISQFDVMEQLEIWVGAGENRTAN